MFSKILKDMKWYKSEFKNAVLYLDLVFNYPDASVTRFVDSKVLLRRALIHDGTLGQYFAEVEKIEDPNKRMRKKAVFEELYYYSITHSISSQYSQYQNKFKARNFSNRFRFEFSMFDAVYVEHDLDKAMKLLDS